MTPLTRAEQQALQAQILDDLREKLARAFLLEDHNVDALRAGAAALRANAAVHAKFGFVAGADGKCACAYCVGDAEALADACADYEMKNHTLTQQLAALRASAPEAVCGCGRVLDKCWICESLPTEASAPLEPAHHRLTMSQACKHAQHSQCDSPECWCGCHPECRASAPPETTERARQWVARSKATTYGDKGLRLQMEEAQELLTVLAKGTP